MHRKSNIELMRIILFVMVVSIHISGPYLSYSTVTGTLNWQISHFIDGFSRIAVSGFVLITGYFLCVDTDNKSKKHIEKLLFPLVFYIPLYALLYFIENKNIFYAVLDLMSSLLKNQKYFYHMWYIQTIIVIYILSPYINKTVKSINKNQLKKLIIILLFPASIMPTLCYISGYNFFDNTLLNSRLLLFIVIYLIGTYIRMYGSQNDKSIKYLILFFITNTFIVILSFIYNYKFSPYIYVNNLMGIDLSYPLKGFIGAFFDFNNLLVILSSVFFFKLILNLNFQNNIINQTASLAYGAYICHVFWINILSKIKFINPFLYYNSELYPIVIFLFILFVSVLSLATEYVRQILVKNLKGPIK